MDLSTTSPHESTVCLGTVRLLLNNFLCWVNLGFMSARTVVLCDYCCLVLCFERYVRVCVFLMEGERISEGCVFSLFCGVMRIELVGDPV